MVGGARGARLPRPAAVHAHVPRRRAARRRSRRSSSPCAGRRWAEEDENEAARWTRDDPARAEQPVLLALSLLLATPLPARPQAARPAAPGTAARFPAQAEVVTVDVVVTDRKGEPVARPAARGLHGERGRRRAGGRRVRRGAPAGAAPPALRGAPRRPAPEPRSSSNREPAARAGSHFVIVFDELHLGAAEAVRARKAVAEFLASGVADGDRVALVGHGAEGTRWTARMPEGRDALRQALDAAAAEARRRDGARPDDRLRGDAHRPRPRPACDRRRDAALPRHGRDPAGHRVAGQRGDRRTPTRSRAGATRCSSRAAGVYARATARNEQALGVVERSLEALAARARAQVARLRRPAASSRTPGSASTARW